MPIHKLVPGQPHDPASPLLGQVLPRPEPLDPPPEPDPVTSPPVIADLTDALRLKGMLPTDRMVLRDQHGRVLCLQARSGDWGWVYLGDPKRYSADMVPLVVHVDLAAQEIVLAAEKKMVNWSLFANGNTSRETSVFAGFKLWKDYPRLRFKIKRRGTTIVNQRQMSVFTLGWTVGSTHMVLHAPAGDWGWLKLVPERDVPDDAQSRFSLHKLLMPSNKISDLLKATWPNATLGCQLSVDDYYEAVSEQQARSIWDNARLKDYGFKPEVFDCDEFAMAYKTQAAKDAYAQNGLYPYSVGIVYGQNAKGAHAANLFVDQWLRLQLIEPQTGAVQRASEWGYTPFHVMI